LSWYQGLGSCLGSSAANDNTEFFHLGESDEIPDIVGVDERPVNGQVLGVGAVEAEAHFVEKAAPVVGGPWEGVVRNVEGI